jgi:hypothetical protein
MKKRFEILVLMLLLIPYSILIAQISDGVKLENVMAVYIYNFTKFLEWPKDDSENFYIYVLGKSNLIEPLNKIAEKEKVNGRKIVISELEDLNNLKSNSVLFLTAEEGNRLNAILKRTTEKNILTISNSEGLAYKGVCINFFIVDNKIKFEINRKAIEETGIIPNTRLLSLAVKVYE